MFRVIQGHSRLFEIVTMYLVPFPGYLPSNNGVTSKSGLRSFMVIENGTIRKLGYMVFYLHSIVTMALSCIISEIHRDTGY